jgi:Fe-S cluster assembly iron-binding protein IscA
MSQHASKKGNVPAAIKVGVRKGGCSGFVYTLQFADSVQASDEVVQDEGMVFNSFVCSASYTRGP